MNKINATFVGGPLGGKILEIEDLDTYHAFDQLTGEEVVYERQAAVVPNSAGPDTVIYVITGQSDDEILGDILGALSLQRQK